MSEFATVVLVFAVIALLASVVMLRQLAASMGLILTLPLLQVKDTPERLRRAREARERLEALKQKSRDEGRLVTLDELRDALGDVGAMDVPGELLATISVTRLRTNNGNSGLGSKDSALTKTQKQHEGAEPPTSLFDEWAEDDCKKFECFKEEQKRQEERPDPERRPFAARAWEEERQGHAA